MAEYHFPVPGSGEEKRIVLFLRRHWASYLGQIVLSFFLFFFPIILGLAAYFTDSRFFHGILLNFIVLGFSTYYLVISTFIFSSLLSFYYDLYIVTDDSIIDVVQQGFLGRRIIQISLLRVQDVSSNIQGLFATLFSYGNVLIETAGEQTQNLLLEQVPNPQEVAARIISLHHQLIEAEGRHRQILEAEGVLAPRAIGKLGQEEVAKAEPLEFPTPEAEETPKTTYRELLEKEKVQTRFGEISEEKKPTEEAGEGEIEHDDLDKGGTIRF